MTHKKNLLLLFCLCLSLVASWYKPGLIIGGGEESLSFLYPARTSTFFQYSWSEVQAGEPQAIATARFPLYWLLGQLNNLGIPSDLLQIGLFFSLIILSAFSIYFLAKLMKDQPFFCLIVSLFYLLNPFMYANIWHRFLISMAFFMPLIPISLICFYLALKTKRLLFLSLFLVCSFLLAPAFTLPSNVITLWLILGLFYLSQVVESRTALKQVLLSTVLFLLFLSSWIITNSWWLITLFFQSTDLYGTVFSLQQNLSTLRSISSQYPLWHNLVLYYNNSLPGYYLYLGLIFPLLAILGLKTIKISWRLFFVFLILVSIFFLNGVGHFGGLFEYLFTNFGFFQAFRNPYEKFGIVLVFSYAFLIALTLNFLFERKKILAVVVMAILSLLLVPHWFTQVFGTKEINAYIKVPADYQQVNQLLNQDSEPSRVLHLPLSPGDGTSYKWPSPYFGYIPNQYLFDKSSLDKVTRQPLYDGYWQSLRAGFYQGKLADLVKYGNIGYLVVHKDIDNKYAQTDDFSTTNQYLNNGVYYTHDDQTIVCTAIKLLDQVSNFTANCDLTEDQDLWTRTNFINFSIESVQAGYLKVSLVSKNGERLVFNGENDPKYQVKTQLLGQKQNLLFDLRLPTERYSQFNQKELSSLIIQYYPKDNLETSQPEIADIKVSPGERRPFTNKRLILQTTNLDLYQISPESYYPHLYSTTKLTQLSDWNELNRLSFSPAAFFLDSQRDPQIDYTYQSESKPEVTETKINNTHYRLSIQNANSPYWLVFSESFNSNWQLSDSSQEYKHFLINGFTNGFFVSKTGDYQLELKYKVQAKANWATLISIIAAPIIYLLAFFIDFKKFRIKF